MAQCHAYIHINLHTRRLRNVESPSVPGSLLPFLAPCVLRRHGAQPRTALRPRRRSRRPPALSGTFRSRAVDFIDRWSVEAISDRVDPGLSRTGVPLATRFRSVLGQSLSRSWRSSLHRAAGAASPQKDLRRRTGGSAPRDWDIGWGYRPFVAAAFAAARVECAFRSPGKARGLDCGARPRALDLCISSDVDHAICADREACVDQRKHQHSDEESPRDGLPMGAIERPCDVNHALS